MKKWLYFAAVLPTIVTFIVLQFMPDQLPWQYNADEVMQYGSKYIYLISAASIIAFSLAFNFCVGFIKNEIIESEVKLKKYRSKTDLLVEYIDKLQDFLDEKLDEDKDNKERKQKKTAEELQKIAEEKARQKAKRKAEKQAEKYERKHIYEKLSKVALARIRKVDMAFLVFILFIGIGQYMLLYNAYMHL